MVREKWFPALQIRAALKGTNEPKGTDANLRFSAVSCENLRFPAKICGFLRKAAFPKCFVFQEKARICKNLGEFRGILGAALGIGNSILGIRNSILGMASHDLINTKPTILGAIPGIAANPPERFSFAPAFSERFF